MTIKSTTPYLNFNGDAEKAIELYKHALGAKVEMMQRFSEVPGMNVPAEMKNRVIHALLKIGGGVVMISDSMPQMPVAPGTNTHIALDFDDVAEMNRAFDALGAGGKITMAIHDSFWGAKFGMLIDAFGIQWMFNSEIKKG